MINNHFNNKKFLLQLQFNEFLLNNNRIRKKKTLLYDSTKKNSRLTTKQIHY